MLFVDAKFASMLGPRLRNYKKTGDYTWNFSCPVCGDSSTKKSKARGYIYKMKADLFVKCHNCGYGTNIGNFIKFLDANLYSEYVLERYKGGATRYNDHKDIAEVNPQFLDTKPTLLLEDEALKGLTRIDRLKETHPAVKYVASRQIPRDKWHLLYFCTKFKKWTNSMVPRKFSDKSLEEDHPRLVFPFFNAAGKMYAYSGRSFGAEEPRYYTIKLDEDAEKVYGLDRIDWSKRIYVVEGQVDSLFLPNCIAVAGASFDNPTIQKIKTNCTIIMDNEPRNKDIAKQLAKYIENGYTVCMLPDTIEQKDINEMILTGKTVEQVLETINTNTFQGMEAKLRYTTWRKF